MLAGLTFIAGWVAAHFVVCHVGRPDPGTPPAASRELTGRQRTVVLWLGSAALLAVLAPTCVGSVRLRLFDALGERGGIGLPLFAIGLLVGIAHGLMTGLAVPAESPAVQRDRSRALLVTVAVAAGTGVARWWWSGGAATEPDPVTVAWGAGGVAYFVVRGWQRSFRGPSDRPRPHDRVSRPGTSERSSPDADAR